MFARIICSCHVLETLYKKKLRYLLTLTRSAFLNSKENEDLSSKAMARFNILLRSLSQPMSLKDIAKTWDACARAVICEYAQQFGGGTFSSKYGTWEKYVAAS